MVLIAAMVIKDFALDGDGEVETRFGGKRPTKYAYEILCKNRFSKDQKFRSYFSLNVYCRTRSFVKVSLCMRSYVDEVNQNLKRETG